MGEAVFLAEILTARMILAMVPAGEVCLTGDVCLPRALAEAACLTETVSLTRALAEAVILAEGTIPLAMVLAGEVPFTAAVAESMTGAALAGPMAGKRTVWKSGWSGRLRRCGRPFWRALAGRRCRPRWRASCGRR